MAFDVNSYDPVDSRIQKFWAEHPNGAIICTLMSNPDTPDPVVLRADVYFDKVDERPTSSGHSMGSYNERGMADKTAWLENAETSAIGRALANCGYKAKIDSPRPSLEEMQKDGAIQRGPQQQAQGSGSWQRSGGQQAPSEGETFPDKYPRSLKTPQLVELAHANGFKGTNTFQLRNDVENTYTVKIKGTAPDGGVLPVDVANAIAYYKASPSGDGVESDPNDIPFD